MPWLASPNYHPHLTHHFISLKPRTPTPLNYETLHYACADPLHYYYYVKSCKSYSFAFRK